MVRFSLDAVLDVSDDHDDDDNEVETTQIKDVPTEYSDSDDDDEAAHPLGFGTSWSNHATAISASWGRTRFCVDPPRETLRDYQKRWGYPEPLLSSSTKLLSPQQTFPPLSSYLDPETAPTAALARLSLHHQEQDQKQQQDGSLLRLTMSSTTRPPSSPSNALVVLKSPTASPSSALSTTPSLLSPAPPLSKAYLEVGKEMQKLAQVSKVRYHQVQENMQYQKQQLQQEHEQFLKALQVLLRDDETRAAQVRKEQEQQMQLRQQQEEEREEQARQEEEEATAKEEQAMQQKLEQQQQQQKAQKEASEARAAAAQQQQQQQQQRQQKNEPSTSPRRAPTSDKTDGASDIPDYVTQAQKLVSKLVQVRASVAPFETSKLVSQRRLGMKKIVNGKVNTLSESVDKIRQVAQEVSQAISQARALDEQVKQQQQQQPQQQIPPEMARGKRYLVDLLASSVIVRAQAEGFNGPRGDGFPLASMLAMVSVEQKDLVLIFAAHVYTVCPTAIPTLPRMASLSHDDDEALQKSLGMAKTKTGEYETFERFLSRTEGIVSLVADIMSSEPSTHVLMGGHKGAVEWLDRFLSLLPPAPAAPLPLITAPVLMGFLTRAGHMLANKHATEFTKHVELIANDIVKRLDDGAIGKPSATRLAKLVEGGFAYFRQTLPSKSLPELYHGASGGGGGGSTLTSSSSPFGRPASTATPALSQPSNNSPFGAKQDSVTSPFGGSSSTSNPFGSGSTATTVPNPFGGGQPGTSATASVPNPFGGGQSSNPPSSFLSSGIQNIPPANTDSMMTNDSNAFGAGMLQSTQPTGGTSFSGMALSSGGTSTPFGGQSSTSNPFGTSTASSNPSPFGLPSTTTATPFGNPSSFGGSAPVQSPFGPPSSTSSATPFGSGTTTPFGGGIAPSPSPFGQSASSFQSPFGQSATSPSPFTQPASAPSPSPFGAPFGQTTSTPTPFGQAAPAPTPFGQAPTPSPFGQPALTPTPFGQPAPTPFGQAAPTPSPFGQPGATPSPFGQPAPSPSPFGQAAPTPSPFGQTASSPSPFGQTPSFGGGGNAQPSPYGAPQNGPTRGSDGRELCKFFAKGACSYGANCRFSHEQPPGGFGSGTSSSSPFGGPRR